MKYTITEVRTYPLEEAMKSRGISCRKFAEYVGMDYSHLFRLTKGVYKTSEARAHIIIQAIESLPMKEV